MKNLFFALLMLLSISSITQAQTIAYEWDAAADTTKLPSTKKFNRAVLKGDLILVTTTAVVKSQLFTAGDIIYAKKNRPTLLSDFGDITPTLFNREFKAIITQSSTSAPTISVLQNGLKLPTLTFTRTSAGIYESQVFTLTGLTASRIESMLTNNIYLSAGNLLGLHASINNAGGSNWLVTIRVSSITDAGVRTFVDLGASAILTIRQY